MATVHPQPPRTGPVMRQIGKLVATRAGAWVFVNVACPVDRALLPLTRGKVRTTLAMRIVVLTHTGAKSGTVRQTPLIYFSDGEDVILVASNGGSPRNPAWYHNALAQPEVTLSDGANTGPYRVTEASGAERERLWQAGLQMYPGWATYQARTGGRVIPVLVLSPAAGDAPEDL
ncbi:MAG: nitroreductase/quinone reductase family protein [Sporichthyaceae bacterium]